MKKGITLIALVITLIVIAILISTVSIYGINIYNKEVKMNLASEIASLKVATDNYYVKFGIYPSNNNIVVDISNVKAESKKQFEKEDIIDNKVILQEIDYNILGFKALKYGLKENGDNDVYAVSNITGNVYYVKGVAINNYTYYTLNDELKELVDYNEIDISNSNADGIIIKSSNVAWTNENISVEVRIPNNLEVVSVLNGTASVSYNSHTDNYYVYNITGINSNRNITVNYKVDSQSKIETFKVNNIDKESPILTISDNQKLMASPIDKYAYTTLTTTDETSDIRVVKYENEKIGDSSFEGMDEIKNYFKTNGISIYEGMLNIQPNVKEITVYIEDLAGNWTAQHVTVDEEIVTALGLNKPETSNPGLDNNGVLNAAAIMKPVLGDALTPVTINANLSETTTTADNSNWYAYIDQGSIDEKTSKWANAVTKDSSGNINGVFVWIPRYAYKIDTNTIIPNSNNANPIDVIFVDKENKQVDGSELPSGYIVHPAFKKGSSTGFTNGEWDKELAGIWVGKYEVSGSTSNLKVRPNEVSLRSVKISDMFTASLNFDNTVKNGSDLDSHMMKNSEWGAVAYLAHSQYGRNGTEVTINDSGYTSGSDGVNTSTTGNTTGVYDMSGAAYERTAGYVNNGNLNLQINGADLISNGGEGTSNKYKTVYTKGSSDSNILNYSQNSSKIGDAIHETSTAGSNQTSWFTNDSTFPYSAGTFFLRGGYYNNGSGAGLFFFYDTDGNSQSSISWRLVLALG